VGAAGAAEAVARLEPAVSIPKVSVITPTWRRRDLCPVHGTGLHPVQMQYPVRQHGRDIAGHCSPCGRYWFYDPDEAEAGWMLDHDPATGAWVPPQRHEWSV
jgi:hypothetical protein